MRPIFFWGGDQTLYLSIWENISLLRFKVFSSGGDQTFYLPYLFLPFYLAKHTVDGRSPAPVDIENIPFFRVSCITGG